jgi:serine phosphatase RsbU (regulator of sigma subunit)
MQWALLPPLTFATSQMAISGVLQPSYKVAGDSFDYAVDSGILHLAIVDAMGHGFEASLLATVAISAYRHARRRNLDLQAAYAEVDEVLARQFGTDRFVTGVLARLDIDTGVLRWLPAGHPPPLLVRSGKVIGELEAEPATPMGFDDGKAEVAETSLEPGDRLLLYSDGVVEARAADGAFFGLDRLGELLSKAQAADLPMPETARRLAHEILAHQAGELQDDATLVLVEWRGPAGR